MPKTCTIEGRVLEVFDDRDATITVLRIGDGTTKAGREWTNDLAVRWWRDGRHKLQGVAPGEFVRVDVEVRSRKSQQGRWFTDANGRDLEILSQAKDAPPPKEDPAADDDIPF